MTQIENDQTIVFIGDSITDCWRTAAEFAPLGKGYVKIFTDMMAVREPAKTIKVINRGIAGNTIEDLRNRWVDDALSRRPDWLCIKIGINDCCSWIHNKTNEQCVERFAEMYDELLALSVKELPDVKVLLIDPFHAGLDVNGALPGSHRAKIAELLPEYIKVVHEMSKKYSTYHVPMDQVFKRHFEVQHPSVFFPEEPVHPNVTGHMLIAEEVYKALS